MATVDLLFLVFLAVIQPIYGGIRYRRLIRRIRQGQPYKRSNLYLQTMLLEWVMLTCLLMIWIVQGRSFTQLGFTAPQGLGFWYMLAGAAIFSGLLVHSWTTVNQWDESRREKHRQSLGDLIYFIPHNNHDFKYFCAVSITAGIVEEIIYRGFLFWLLAQFAPMWAVILLSSFVFGLAHSYQGFAGMVKVFLVGLVAAIVYVVSGSLWVPIVLHAVFDILQGGAIKTILSETKEDKATKIQSAN